MDVVEHGVCVASKTLDVPHDSTAHDQPTKLDDGAHLPPLEVNVVQTPQRTVIFGHIMRRAFRPPFQVERRF